MVWGDIPPSVRCGFWGKLLENGKSAPHSLRMARQCYWDRDLIFDQRFFGRQVPVGTAGGLSDSAPRSSNCNCRPQRPPKVKRTYETTTTYLIYSEGSTRPLARNTLTPPGYPARRRRASRPPPLSDCGIAPRPIRGATPVVSIISLLQNYPQAIDGMSNEPSGARRCSITHERNLTTACSKKKTWTATHFCIHRRL